MHCIVILLGLFYNTCHSCQFCYTMPTTTVSFIVIQLGLLYNAYHCCQSHYTMPTTTVNSIVIQLGLLYNTCQYFIQCLSLLSISLYNAYHYCQFHCNTIRIIVQYLSILYNAYHCCQFHYTMSTTAVSSIV